MHTTAISRFLDMIRPLGLSLQNAAGHFMKWLPGANWLQILVICIPIAFVVTILPLVIMLFALFFVVKLWLRGSHVAPLASSSIATHEQSTGVPTNPEARTEQ